MSKPSLKKSIILMIHTMTYKIAIIVKRQIISLLIRQMT